MDPLFFPNCEANTSVARSLHPVAFTPASPTFVGLPSPEQELDRLRMSLKSNTHKVKLVASAVTQSAT